MNVDEVVVRGNTYTDRDVPLCKSSSVPDNRSAIRPCSKRNASFISRLFQRAEDQDSKTRWLSATATSSSRSKVTQPHAQRLGWSAAGSFRPIR